MRHWQRIFAILLLPGFMFPGEVAVRLCFCAGSIPSVMSAHGRCCESHASGDAANATPPSCCTSRVERKPQIEDVSSHSGHRCRCLELSTNSLPPTLNDAARTALDIKVPPQTASDLGTIRDDTRFVSPCPCDHHPPAGPFPAGSCPMLI